MTTRHAHDHRDDLDLLRSLDLTPATLDPAESARADALLERLLTTPRAGRDVGDDARPRVVPSWSARRVAVAVVAASAAAGAAVVIVPDASHSAAYASWTPRATTVGSDDVAAVTQACRDQLSRGASGNGADLGTIPLVLSERRGDYVALLFRDDEPDTSASCIAFAVPGSGTVSDVRTGVGGSDGTATRPPAGRITEGSIAQFADPLLSVTDGAVGAGVVGVTIRADGLTVRATVTDGRYAAWWPGRAFPAEPAPPSGEGGPEPLLTYDIHLADGTTQRDITPYRPS